MFEISSEVEDDWLLDQSLAEEEQHIATIQFQQYHQLA